MLISTHLPPPVMIESTAALRVATTHMLCCSCGMYFSAAASSENDHGSMNLASNTAPLPSTRPSRVAAIQRSAGWRTVLLDVGDDLPGIGLVPAPVEVLGDDAELDDEVAGQVLRLDFAALFPPQPQQGGLVIAHDDPGVRAADEASGDRQV